MATLTAVRCNSVLAPAHHCYRAAGKPAKLALTACMRKLLVMLNAMVHHQTAWDPAYASRP